MTEAAPGGGPADGAGLTDEFWEEAARGILVRPVCEDCGRSFFTPRVLCPHCRSARWHYRPSSGLGTVHSHTTVHRGPDETWEVPYVLGIVDMDEGWDLLTQLLVEPPAEDDPGALIGLDVQVDFIDGHPPDTHRLPAFSPRGNDPSHITPPAAPPAAEPQESQP